IIKNMLRGYAQMLAHRWRPAQGFRVGGRRRRAAIRCSAGLGGGDLLLGEVRTSQKHNADSPENAIGKICEAANSSKNDIIVITHSLESDRMVPNGIYNAQHAGNRDEKERPVPG